MLIHMSVCMHIRTPSRLHTHASAHLLNPVLSVCPAGRPLAVQQQPPAVNHHRNPADIISHLLPDFLTLTGWNRWWAREGERGEEKTLWQQPMTMPSPRPVSFILLFSRGEARLSGMCSTVSKLHVNKYVMQLDVWPLGNVQSKQRQLNKLPHSSWYCTHGSV